VADTPRRRLKRGAAVALAIVVVAVVAIGVVAFVRSRRIERSVDALCQQLTAAQDLDQSFTTLDPATLDPQVKSLAKAKAVAPDDIKASVDTLADFVSGLAKTVNAAQTDRSTALADALEARQDQVDSVTAAGKAVQQWAQANCGLALTGADNTTSTTGSASGSTTTATPPR